MTTILYRLSLFILTALTGTGCTFDGGGGKSYEFDPSKIGTGQQAIVPLTDGTHLDGQSLDNRRGHNVTQQ